jgi:hypothetical protein
MRGCKGSSIEQHEELVGCIRLVMHLQQQQPGSSIVLSAVELSKSCTGQAASAQPVTVTSSADCKLAF